MTRPSSSPFKIVVTGGECTGKTTLAQELAGRLASPCSTEGARTYLDEVRRPLTVTDVESIANRQIKLEQDALYEAKNLVILDTDLFSTVTYSRHYYGECVTWIVEMAIARRADLYLVCDIDVPWTADGLQRDRSDPAERAEVHQAFIAELTRASARYEIVSGTQDTRLGQAMTLIHDSIGPV